MRKIEYGKAGKFLAIEGCEVDIVSFGLSGGATLTSPHNEEIRQIFQDTQDQYGNPEHWKDTENAEIPFTLGHLATCGLAITNWQIEHPIDTRLNTKTARYASLTTSREIARSAFSVLGFHLSRMIPNATTQQILSSQSEAWAQQQLKV
jgi:hypothetical protein